MPNCPNGHQSATDDWCEVCGTRMAPSAYPPRPTSSASASSASTASAPPSSASPPGFDAGLTAAAEVCPQCGTPREGAALFCEECRYNFRTHSATVAPTSPSVPVSPGFPPYPRYESQQSRPSQVNRPAEPVPSESVTVNPGSGDFLLDPPSTPVRPDPGTPSPPAAAEPVPTVGGPSSTPSSSSVATSASGSSAVPAVAGRATAWVAVITADREYFTVMMARSGPDAQGLYFPAFSPEVQLPLIGNQITIGRRRHSTGGAPDIDLSRAPEDPGVSHQHAVLVQQPDGTWAVIDQDSTNGTTVNLAQDSIRPYTPVPLDEGDRVHVGAWTTITIQRVRA